MSYPKFTLENDLEERLYEYLVALNVAVQEKQDKYDDEFSPKVKEVRKLLREDPYYSLFHISSSSYHIRKKDWNSLLGKQYELFVGILLERFVPDPIPEPFKLPKNRQLCDYPVIFDEEKFALEIKNRYGSADRRIREGYLKIYDQIKEIDNGTWQPAFLIRSTDNVPAAINQWMKKGWQVYQGEEMNDFLIKYTGFNLNKFLNKITLPRIRQTPDTEDELNDYLSRKED